MSEALSRLLSAFVFAAFFFLASLFGGQPVSNITPATIAVVAIRALVIFFARDRFMYIIYGELKNSFNMHRLAADHLSAVSPVFPEQHLCIFL